MDTGNSPSPFPVGMSSRGGFFNISGALGRDLYFPFLAEKIAQNFFAYAVGAREKLLSGWDEGGFQREFFVRVNPIYESIFSV